MCVGFREDMKKLKRNRGIWKTILLPGAIGLMCLVMTGAAMAESEAEIPPQEAAVQETAEAVQPVPDAAAPVIPPENPPADPQPAAETPVTPPEGMPPAEPQPADALPVEPQPAEPPVTPAEENPAAEPLPVEPQSAGQQPAEGTPEDPGAAPEIPGETPPPEASSEEPVPGEPAVPTEVPTDAASGIQAELLVADRTVMLENEIAFEGDLKPEQTYGIYRVGLGVRSAGNVEIILTVQDQPVEAIIAQADGTRQVFLKEEAQENPAVHVYHLTGYAMGSGPALIRLIGPVGVHYTMVIRLEAAEGGGEGQEPGGDEPVDPEPVEPVPIYYGGGGGGSWQPHAKNKKPQGPDYDTVSLNGIGAQAEDTAVMNRLTLGETEMDLTLEQTDENAGGFTVTAIRWGEPPETEPEAEETKASQETVPPQPDTLVLTAKENAAGAKNVWSLNGAVLRQLHKSGIDHLVLRQGDVICAMETEGFLGGWEYDEMKSRGTASRRFEYRIETDGAEPAVWQLNVEGESFSLTRDAGEGIHLTAVYDAPAEALERPWTEMSNAKP